MALLVEKHWYFEKEGNHSKITEIIAVKTLTCSNNSVGWYCCRKTTVRNLLRISKHAKHDVIYHYAGIKDAAVLFGKGGSGRLPDGGLLQA